MGECGDFFPAQFDVATLKNHIKKIDYTLGIDDLQY